MSNTQRSAARGYGHGYAGPRDWIDGFDPTRDGALTDTRAYPAKVRHSQRRTSRHNDTHTAHMIAAHGFDPDATPWDLHRLNPWAWD